jgi:hypothetical protein
MDAPVAILRAEKEIRERHHRDQLLGECQDDR